MAETVKVLIIVERGKGKNNFSCFSTQSVEDFCFGGYGSTAREAMEDCRVSLQEAKEMAAEKDKTFPDVEFEYRFDIGAFFDYYPIDVTAFAKYIGMNPSMLRRYATALRQPKQETIDRIREGIQQLSGDLGANMMVEHPVLTYVK